MAEFSVVTNKTLQLKLAAKFCTAECTAGYIVSALPQTFRHSSAGHRQSQRLQGLAFNDDD